MEILFFIISIALMFLMHKLLSLVCNTSLKKLYDFYFEDEFGAGYFVLLNITLIFIIFISLIASNNTFWHFKYLFF